MAIIFFLRNIIAFVILIALIVSIIWLFSYGPVGRAIVSFFQKRKEYYDIENLDDIEILARKYEEKGKKKNA